MGLKWGRCDIKCLLGIEHRASVIRTSHDLIYHASFPPALPQSLSALSHRSHVEASERGRQQRLFLHAARPFSSLLRGRLPSVNRQNSPFDVLARSLTLARSPEKLLSPSVFFPSFLPSSRLATFWCLVPSQTLCGCVF